MKQAFITGTSKGLGKAMAEQLLERGWSVVGIGRTHTIHHKNYTSVICDLSLTQSAEHIELNIKSEAEELLLVNNAAGLYEIGYFGEISNATFQNGLQLNLIAPAILMNRFISLTNDLKMIRKILNISSGASVNPYDGWGMYGASKAGIDTFTSSLTKELAKKSDKRTFVYSVAPGVVDTGMQEYIRKAPDDSFSAVERFREMHKNNQLSSPNIAASKVLSVIFASPEKPSGRYDVREL